MTDPIPVRGDRAARDSKNYPGLHASDLEEGSGLQHLPQVSGDGDILERSSGAWVPIEKTSVPLDDWGTPGDTTDLDATAEHHGLLPKLSGSSDDSLKGDGTWGPGGGGASSFSDLDDVPAYAGNAKKYLRINSTPDGVEAVTAEQIQDSVTVTTTHTIGNDENLVLADASGGSFALTLPTAIGKTGKLYRIIRIDTNDAGDYIVIGCFGTEKINGYPSFYLLYRYETITVVSTGTDWVVLPYAIDFWRYEPIASFTAGTYTLHNKYTLVFANSTSGAITFNLNSVSDLMRKKIIIVKTNWGGSNITIDANGSETINGNLTYVMTKDYEVVTLYCTGAAWIVSSATRNYATNIDTSAFTGILAGATNVQSALNTLDYHGHSSDKIALDPGDMYSGLLSGQTQLDGALGVLDGLIVPAIMKDVTYFVNVSTGNDGNDGLTSGTALATIQAAINKFKGYSVSNCKISIAAGTYVERVMLEGIGVPVNTDLQFEGDTRTTIAVCYMHGGVHYQSTYRGAGTISLATDNSGTGGRIRVTVTASTTNPDFQSDGIAAGDKVFTWNGSTLTEFTVYSVSSNVVTLDSTAGAPSLNTNGRYFVIQPNVKIDGNTGGTLAFRSDISCRLTGIYGYGGNTAGFYLLSQTFVMQNCLGYCTATGDTAAGIFLDRKATVFTSSTNCGIGYNGLTALNSSSWYAGYSYFCGTYRGVYTYQGCDITLSNCFIAVGPSSVGVYAGRGSYIYASGRAAYNWASTKWSPSTTDTLGNNMGAITFS